MIVESDESNDQVEEVTKRRHNLTLSDIQRIRIDRLMSDPEKPAFIPDAQRMTIPRAFEPHEFIHNVMGASAGAGSREFDIYRRSRRRQQIRQNFCYFYEKQKMANDEWSRQRSERQQILESKTAKKRAKRQRHKERSKTKKEEISKLVHDSVESVLPNNV